MLLLWAGCATTRAPSVIDSYGWHAPAMGIASLGRAVVRVGGGAPDMCIGQLTPWKGPALCGGEAILRPGLAQCDNYADTTPRLHPVTGHYRAERDPGNWIDPSGGDVLEVLQVHVIDNGEGEDGPHGPYGNLYWDVFGSFEPLMESADGAKGRRLTRARVLRGPHRTHGDNDEWLDDEALMYSGAGLFRWGSEPGTETAIVLRIWESDGSEDGRFGRRNDVLGMEPIRRVDADTACGIWVPFRRYHSGHPRKRSSQVALWMLLRNSRSEAAGRWARVHGLDAPVQESANDVEPWIRPTEAKSTATSLQRPRVSSPL